MADAGRQARCVNVRTRMLTPAAALPVSARNGTRLVPLAAPLLIACATGVAAASGVWRCAVPGAAPVYQDRPCDAGRQQKDLAADPPPLSIVPMEMPVRPAEPKAKPRRAEAPSPKPRRAESRIAGDAALRRHVREGMTEGEVLARLGTPDLASPKGGRKGRWTYLPAAGDPQTITLVRFEDGAVVAVERRVVR